MNSYLLFNGDLCVEASFQISESLITKYLYSEIPHALSTGPIYYLRMSVIVLLPFLIAIKFCNFSRPSHLGFQKSGQLRNMIIELIISGKPITRLSPVNDDEVVRSN